MTFHKKVGNYALHVVEYLDSAEGTELPRYSMSQLTLISFLKVRQLQGSSKSTCLEFFCSTLWSEECWWESWWNILILRSVQAYNYLLCFSKCQLDISRHSCRCVVPECANEVHIRLSAPPVSRAGFKYTEQYMYQEGFYLGYTVDVSLAQNMVFWGSNITR